MAQHRRKPRATISIPMCLACVLLCLTLLSIHFSTTMVARYSTVSTADDSARVIRFGDLTLVETVADTQFIAPGKQLNWNAHVTFTGSESATYVFVEVSGVAAGDADSVTLFNGGPEWPVNTATWDYVGNYGSTHVYFCPLAPNDETMNQVYFFTQTTATVSPGFTAAQIEAIGNISASFGASVVQSNGFDTPAEAWESLENNHKRT